MKAISWAAVSTKPQADKESLHDQHAKNRALAEALDWQILCDLTVPGESRNYRSLEEARAAIAAYKSLCDLSADGAFDWLICKNRSRLGRTRRLNREVAAFLQDHGIRIYSRAFPPANTEKRTEAEVWSEAIESGYSEAEILRLKQRREMGMRARVKAGKPPAALPWGFSHVPHPHREEPTVALTDPLVESAVRFVVTAFLKGLNKSAIVRRAEERELPTASGDTWTIDSIDYVLNQPAYFGLVGYGRRRRVVEDGKRKRVRVPWPDCIIVEAEFEGVFLPDVWEQVRAEQERRTADHPRSRAAVYPLSGLAWCVEHERFFTGSVTRHVRYYRCRTRWTPRQPSQSHLIHAEKLEGGLGRFLAQLGQDPEAFDQALQSITPEVPDWEAQRQRLDDSEANLLKRRQRWATAYETGVIELGEYARHLSGIEREEDQLAARRGELEAAQQGAKDLEGLRSRLHDAIGQLPELLSSNLTPEQRQIIRASLQRCFSKLHVQNKRIVAAKLVASDVLIRVP